MKKINPKFLEGLFLIFLGDGVEKSAGVFNCRVVT